MQFADAGQTMTQRLIGISNQLKLKFLSVSATTGDTKHIKAEEHEDHSFSAQVQAISVTKQL